MTSSVFGLAVLSCPAAFLLLVPAPAPDLVLNLVLKVSLVLGSMGLGPGVAPTSLKAPCAVAPTSS